MLKNLDPMLTPDLLHALRAMGHGDEIAIVDANYPANSPGPRVVRLDGVDATRALDAILSVMPLDDFVPEACWRMQVVGAPDEEQPMFAEFRASHRQARRRRSSSSRRWSVRILRTRQPASPSWRRASAGSMATSF